MKHPMKRFSVSLRLLFFVLFACTSAATLTAQYTYTFGSGNAAKVSATADGGFLLLYKITNGRLEFQKYDSNAVFQYGHTFPAEQIYSATQRYAKVFSLVDGPHED